MKILISADMEGVCGVTSWVQVMPPELELSPSSTVEYERARLRMTREVNAAAAGAFAAGANEVIVNDSHDGMRNLIPEELHPELRFISGNDKELGMMQGLQEGVDAAFYVGYHAKAGTPAAPLAHTWTGYVQDVRLAGVSTGEFGLNAVLAGHFGVPVVLVTGDDKAVAQVKDFISDKVTGVVVKEGYSTFSALHLHPTKAQHLIQEAAIKALSSIASIQPVKLAKDSLIEVDFDHQSRADQCLFIPGVDRAGERTVSFVAEDALHMNRTFRAIIKASRVQMSP